MGPRHPQRRVWILDWSSLATSWFGGSLTLESDAETVRSGRLFRLSTLFRSPYIANKRLSVFQERWRKLGRRQRARILINDEPVFQAIPHPR
jgi:hypothetical protein